ncbi:MAG: DUF2286 domain-containing protein [Desulfurococcales archaeon]|nr:DUF2286 domain-containing protein [Fervidicoccaceae archaeon]NAZ12037.1 DUF2286 domain-containing protein [Desulfurococcales archaeon]
MRLREMVNPGQIAVIEANMGKLVSREVVDGDLQEIVKKNAIKYAQEKWEPTFSDFMVMKDEYESRLTIPIPKEITEIVKKNNIQLRREDSNTFVAILPVYYIIYESLKIDEDNYHDRGIVGVALVLSDEDVENLTNILIESTKKPIMEELKIEELEEEEEEEKPKKKKQSKS